MNGATMTRCITHEPWGSNWNIVGVGDFNGDGKPDILWGAPDSGPPWLSGI